MPAPTPAPPAKPQFRLATRYPTTIDFPTVLAQAGVDVDQQQRVRKAQELLRSLPEDSPAALKRQIVEAAFTAFDVPTQKIISAATSEVEALEAFIQEGGARAQKVIDEGQARIAELDAEIAEIRESMAAALADQAIRDASTEEQINGVRPILSFFAQTSEPSLGEFLKPREPSREIPRPVFGQRPGGDLSRPVFPPKGEVAPPFSTPEEPKPEFTSNRGASLPDFMTDIDVE